jgi:hypothetical protein
MNDKLKDKYYPRLPEVEKFARIDNDGNDMNKNE